MTRFKFILFIAFALVVVGCGQEEPTPEPTVAPTLIPVPEPTATDVPPTATLEPTETPQPTATPIPSPTPVPASALIEMGDTQLLLSDWRGAEEAYRQAIVNDPENALAHARLAYLLHFHPQTYAEAIEVGREAAELAPTDPVIVSFLIMALTQAGEYEEALAQAEKIDAYAFNNSFALSILADLYLTIGDYEEADRLMDVALLVSGFAFGIERVEIDRVLATHAFLNGVRPTAIQYSNRLFDNAPQFAPAYLVRAQILTSDGLRGVTHRGLVVEGLTLDADYLPLMVELAQLDARAGNFDLALDSCEDVIRLFPELPDGLLCQGDVLLQQEMYEQAEEVYNQVIELNEENYRGYIGRGEAYLGLEDCETAEADLLTALERNPYTVRAYVALGETHICLGNTAEAEAAFQEALTLKPFDPATHFALGNFYLEQNRYDDAGPEYLRAISYAPIGTTPSAYYANLGQTLQAVERCTVSGPTQEVTHFLCAGQFLLGFENYLTAAEAFNFALELDEDSFYGLEGSVAAYANERYCDVSLSYLIRLSSYVEPRSSLVGIFDSNCASFIAGTSTTFEPDGELISEDEARQVIETAVLKIEGMDEVFVLFDTIDPELAGVSEQRILIIEYSTALERDSAELDKQLTDIVFEATEPFILTDSEPLFLLVRARVGLNDLPAGYFVTRFSAIFWYNGDITTRLYTLTWNSIDDLLESLEESEEDS